MRSHWKSLFLATALGAFAVAHAGTVMVTWNHPEQFRDAIDAPGPYPTASLHEISDYLQLLGRRYLPADQHLTVELLDVDLLGKLQPSRHTASGWIRVARSPLDWPHAKVRYTLSAHGQVIRSGEESVSDMAFNSHIGVYGTDPLRYEKRMLAEWFRTRFSAPVLAGAVRP